MSKQKFWRSVMPLCAVLLLDAMSFGFILPELGPMLLQVGPHNILPIGTSSTVRYMVYSITISITMMTMFVGAPLMGSLSDRVGRRKALLLSLTGITISSLLCAVGVAIASITLLITGRALVGLMNGNESIAQAAMADISTEDDKVINMSYVSLAGTLGFVLGPILGGVFADSSLVSWFNFQMPFYISAGLSALNAVVLGCLFRETFVPDPAKIRKWYQGFLDLRLAFSDSNFASLSWQLFLMEFAWGLYFQAISILLVKRFGFSTQEIGMYMTFIAICFMVVLMVIIRILLKHLRVRTIIKLAFPILAAGGFLLPFVHGRLVVYLAVIPLTLGVGLSYNTLLSLISDAADAEHQGQAMGMSISIIAVAWVLAGLCSGWMSSFSIHLPYMVVGLASLVAWLVALRSKQK